MSSTGIQETRIITLEEQNRLEATTLLSLFDFLYLPWWQPFHTDVVCDTLALATRNCSSQGGRGFVASSWTVYNELAATRPDLIHTLSQPNWPHDT